MEEVGIVTKVEGRFARVLVAKKGSVCDSCAMGTCSVSAHGSEMNALNLANAKEGQRVKVTLKAYTYLKGSVIVYGIPALCLILGAVVGKELSQKYFPSSDADIISAIFGFSGLALSFLMVRLWGSRAEKKLEYKPVIEEILGPENK